MPTKSRSHRFPGLAPSILAIGLGLAVGLSYIQVRAQSTGTSASSTNTMVITAICGNNICETALGETPATCPKDCPTTSVSSCGNGLCEPAKGETAQSCPKDCTVNQTLDYCGDGVCSFDAVENATTCPQDCGTTSPSAYVCGDGRCDSNLGESSVTCPADCPATSYVCGNGTCEASKGETATNCPTDCAISVPNPICGNSVCEAAAGENSLTCPADCPATSYVCGNGTCEASKGETATNCPKDCPTVSAPLCGNKICETGESAQSCPVDCGTSVEPAIKFVCGDGLCERDKGESELNCPHDCQTTAAPSVTCQGGTASATVRGSVVYGMKVYTDTCESDTVLKKYSCVNNQVTEAEVKCYGGYVCLAGRCAPGTSPTTTSTAPKVNPCGDGRCDGSIGETATSCPADCAPKAVCGDGRCDVVSGESAVSCPQDCATKAQPGQVLTPEGQAITLPDKCLTARITDLEKCRIYLQTIGTLPATLSGDFPDTCGDGVCQPGEEGACPEDCAVSTQQPTATTPAPTVVNLPSPCVKAGMTDMSSCLDYLHRPTGMNLPDTCINQRIYDTTQCRSTLAAQVEPLSAQIQTATDTVTPTTATVTSTAPTAAPTAKGDIPALCVAQGHPTAASCTQFLSGLYLPDSCLQAGISDDAACRSFLAAHHLPKLCVDQGLLDSDSCQKLVESQYWPPLCKEAKITDANQCRDAFFQKYGQPAACAGLSQDACWQLVLSGRLADADYSTKTAAGALPSKCTTDGATTLDQCRLAAEVQMVPEECLLAGMMTPDSCRYYLFGQSAEAATESQLPDACRATNITSGDACSSYLASNNLPLRCLKAGLSDPEACRSYLAQRDLPEDCRAAGIADVSECQRRLTEKALAIYCPPEISGSNAGSLNEKACKEYIYRQISGDVRCQGQTPDECALAIKSAYLGEVVAAKEKAKRVGDALQALSGKTPTMGTLTVVDGALAEEVAKLLPLAQGTEARVSLLSAQPTMMIESDGSTAAAPPGAVAIDADGDGVPDDVEVRYGLDPKHPETTAGIPDAEALKKLTLKTPVDKAIAADAALGQPLTDGTKDDALAVTEVDNVRPVVAGAAAPAARTKMVGKATFRDVAGQAAAVRFGGQGQPGTTVTLYFYSDLPLIATTTVDANGQWQYDLSEPLSDGPHEVYVAINDETGRVTAKSDPLAFVVKAAQALTADEAYAAAVPATAMAAEVNVGASAAVESHLRLFVLGGLALLVIASIVVVAAVLSRRRD